MNLADKLASDITIFAKYARYIPELKRRETFDEIVDRYQGMMKKKYPKLKEEIVEACKLIREKKILPSMRMLQFAGRAIERGNSRGYNCSYMAASYPHFFRELMFLLLGGSGVGFSVQQKHIAQLPPIKKPNREQRFIVGDSIEGWADAVHGLFRAFFNGKNLPRFDYSDIREKGTPLKTAGGKAPGPGPLRICLDKILALLENKEIGSRLNSSEVADLACFVADAVLSGGIRRAALIALFDIDDVRMLHYKSGAWYELHPERGRVNVSAVAHRGETPKESFDALFNACEMSNAGEPGIVWTNDFELGTNPCFSYETKILTDCGYEEIGSLVGDVNLMNDAGDLVGGKVWLSGVKACLEVPLSDGTKIRCTPNHVFKLENGSECEAKDLQGKRLMPFIGVNAEVNEFSKLGFIQGDGCTGRIKSPFHRGLEINIGDKDREIAEIFGIKFEEGKRAYYTKGFNLRLLELGFSAEELPNRPLPSSFHSWALENQYSFLTGLYSANGCVIKGARVALKSTCKDLIAGVKKFLDDQGIANYVTTNKSKVVVFSNGAYTCKESYDLNIHQRKSVCVFAEKIGFFHSYKRAALVELIRLKAPLAGKPIECGEGPVFDFSLSGDNHWGVVEGVVAHNCGEISLRHKEFCNLCTVNFSSVVSQRDFNKRVRTAAFLGTLQAGFTDFHYLTSGWEENCKEEALLGVSITGIADNPIRATIDFGQAAKEAVEINESTAALIGINKAARVTCIKPEGTASLVLGTSSGVHGRHAPYYIRRWRFKANEPIAIYLGTKVPRLVVPDATDPDGVILELPQKSPDGSLMRDEEHPMSLLERAANLFERWITPGHRTGANLHNVSVTASVKPGEWRDVQSWMWENRDCYSGISLLPFDNGSYVQAPFQMISEGDYERTMEFVKEIDLSEIVEDDDATNLKGEAACAGGSCELP